MVTMQWPASRGLPDAGGGIGAVLTQFDSGTHPDFPYFLKELSGTDAMFWEVTINGGSGGWIEGGHPVEFSVPRRDDVRQIVSNRLAANTLLWLQDGVTMRFESALSKTAAIEIADSVR